MFLYYFAGGFFFDFLSTLFNTVSSADLIFHCAGGCWDQKPSAGIFKQTMGVAVLARQATQAGGIDSLESNLGLLKSLKIRTPDCCDFGIGNQAL
jgi:hypothetical protein